MGTRLTIEDCVRVATARGGRCLSTDYRDNASPLLWECALGHQWTAHLNRVKDDECWCPECWGNIARLTDLQALAAGRGGACLSTEYVNERVPMLWRCSLGHEWSTASVTVCGGSWCPVCSDRVAYTLDDLKQIAQSRGGRCLAEAFSNRRDALPWECEEGHHWSTSIASVVQGAWCPHCAGNARLSLDEMKEIATAHGGECLSEAYVNVATHLRWRCKRGHEWFAVPMKVKGTKRRAGTWCLLCHRIERKGQPRAVVTIADMRAVAEERGGLCLSAEYVNSGTPLQWKCAEGHTWWTRPTNVRNNGAWCPKCGGSEPLTIEDAQSVAESRGGRCLSTEYKNKSTPLEWECSSGHKWPASLGSVQNAGTWCPHCAGNVPLTLDEVRKLAEAKGGRCLAEDLVNGMTPIPWQCANGHQWDAAPVFVKPSKYGKGTWCPECAHEQQRSPFKTKRKAGAEQPEAEVA